MVVQGYDQWRNIIGLRADEMLRVLKKVGENHEQNNRWRNEMPLADAKVRRQEVMDFWAAQDFDLGLEPWDGNCTMCMLKARKVLEYVCRRDPSEARDWAEMELLGGGRFTTEYSINDLIQSVKNSPLLPLIDEFDEFDAECGGWCGGEAS